MVPSISTAKRLIIEVLPWHKGGDAGRAATSEQSSEVDQLHWAPGKPALIHSRAVVPSGGVTHSPEKAMTFCTLPVLLALSNWYSP
ncbi:hypothetical protein D3C81_1774620 [compost metagenome]